MDNEKKRYLEYFKHSEKNDKSQKFLAKQVVKRVTIEGEHNYMFLLKQDENKQSFIELLPIMNAPF